MYVIESKVKYPVKKTGKWKEMTSYFRAQSMGVINHMTDNTKEAKQFYTLAECRRFIRLTLNKRYKPHKIQ